MQDLCRPTQLSTCILCSSELSFEDFEGYRVYTIEINVFIVVCMVP